MLWITILISTKKWGEGKENKEIWKFAGFYLPVFGPGSLAQAQRGEAGGLTSGQSPPCMSVPVEVSWILGTHEPIFMCIVSSQGPLGPAQLSGRCSINVC